MEKVKPALLRGFDQEYLPHEQLQFNHLVESYARTSSASGSCRSRRPRRSGPKC